MKNNLILSFKKESKPTGLYSVGHPYSETHIKIAKKYVGHISPPSWDGHDNWKIRIAVKKDKPDDNPNCNWRWMTVGKSFDTEPDAREWIKANIEKINEIYKIYSFEE